MNKINEQHVNEKGFIAIEQDLLSRCLRSHTLNKQAQEFIKNGDLYNGYACLREMSKETSFGQFQTRLIEEYKSI